MYPYTQMELTVLLHDYRVIFFFSFFIGLQNPLSTTLPFYIFFCCFKLLTNIKDQLDANIECLIHV